MTSDHSSVDLSSPYRHLGGSLPLDDPSYVVREADSQLYQALRDREFCYVLNSRQMGKSSLRVRVMQRLQDDGVACGVVDLSAMGTESTQSAWYKGLAYRIMRNFRKVKSANGRKFDWRSWWAEHDFLSPVQQLGELIQAVLLNAVEENIVIFIDEIDSVLSLGFSTDDFFSWIRSCYNNRADDKDYRRLTFCLLGVATPSDLIADKKRTPFNVGRAIALGGFEFTQAQSALQPGLSQAAIPQPDAVLREILAWTGGQPFLTQKLCQLVVSHFQTDTGPHSEKEGVKEAVEEIVQAHILSNWESKDEPEHLRTIRDRFYAHSDRTNRLLGLYQQILSQKGLKSDGSAEQRELRLTGLTVKRQNQLQVFNPIYHRIFNAEWVRQALADIRPYAPSFDNWIASDGQDVTQLLTGVSLSAAKAWANGKSLSDQDYTYLAACQEAETDHAEAALAVEAQAKEVLAVANHQANRRLKVGAGVLTLAAALLTGSLIFSAQTVQSARGEAAEAKNAAEASRLELTESQTIAAEERENAKLAREAVTKAKSETQAANETTQLAREEAQKALGEAETALSEAKAAEQTARQAQREAASARKNTQRARAETTAALAQRERAEQQVEQAKVNLNNANMQIAAAETERRELTVGTQLERSALALIRTSTRPSRDALVEAVRLGETLRPFVADGRALVGYPAIAPILALQTLLAQMPQHSAVARSGPVTDTSLEETIKVWFSADASRYATLHSYDGFRAMYLQFWNELGKPIGESVEVKNSYGGGYYVPRPLSIYLTDRNTRSANAERDLLAITCETQTICIKDFNQIFEHTHLERVPGEQAAFNPEKKELVTLDNNNVLRRWSLFAQGDAQRDAQGDAQSKWLGRQTAENQIPAQESELYLTADGRYLWTYDYQQGQQDQIQVFDLEGTLVKTHPNPELEYGLSPYLAFSPTGELTGNIELSKLPGQGRQLLSVPLENADAVAAVQIEFLQTPERIALVTQNNGAKTSLFQTYDLAGRQVSHYTADNKSIQVLPHPQGNRIATLECDLDSTQACIGNVWDSEGQRVATVDVLSGGLQWTPNGQYLATWDDAQLRLSDLQTSRTLTYPTGGNLMSFQSEEDQANKGLYFWIRKGGWFELWHTAEEKPMATIYPLGMNASIRKAWYDESSQTVFAVSNHVEYGASLISQPLGLDDIEALIQFDQAKDWAFSPGGDRIVVSQYNGDLQLWSLNGTLEASFIGHKGEIDLVRFSPNGSQLLTYSQVDKTARIWDLQGRQVAEYESELIPSLNADWSQLITLEKRPNLHSHLPETQLKVRSINSLETLLDEACQRLGPFLRYVNDEPSADEDASPQENRRICD